MKPAAWCGNWLPGGPNATGRSGPSAGVTPPREAITRPLGSVTRKSAFWSEILAHSSPAVSRIVAWSPVLNAGAHVRHAAEDQAHRSQVLGARLPKRFVGLEARLHFFIETLRRSRVDHVDSARSSAGDLANSAVSATDVESRIFQRSERRANLMASFRWRNTSRGLRSRAGSPCRTCSCAGLR